MSILLKYQYNTEGDAERMVQTVGGKSERLGTAVFYAFQDADEYDSFIEANQHYEHKFAPVSRWDMLNVLI